MKRILCLILLLPVICTITLSTTSAKSSEKTITFRNINDLREVVIDIYNDNYDELVEIAHKVRSFECDDEYVTFEANCGPCSTAFQKILYDHNIITETTIGANTDAHIFNFYRTEFTDSKGSFNSIIIDTTYKQYAMLYLTHDEITENLPEVLVYEYGNFDDMKAQLKGALNILDENEFNDMCTLLTVNQYYIAYIPQDFQELDFKSSMNYSSAFIDDLRNNGGAYTKPFDTLTLINTEKSVSKDFVYDSNGIYRCYISSEELKVFSTGFNVISPKENIEYGAKMENDTLRVIPNYPSPKTENDVRLISKGSTYPLSLNKSDITTPILISLDFRAGKDAPAIYAYAVGRTLKYGDVDFDCAVNIMDATYLQKAIAKIPSYNLDVFSKETCDVLKTNPYDINNATQICRYVAKFDTPYCGQSLYFSSALELSCNEVMGYIDM
ncbi:MAG: hypothetical protein IKB73_01120 [Ruminococcus sp.]|nr:hypothetical protein [Ruminococcus sp.]